MQIIDFPTFPTLDNGVLETIKNCWGWDHVDDDAGKLSDYKFYDKSGNYMWFDYTSTGYVNAAAKNGSMPIASAVGLSLPANAARRTCIISTETTFAILGKLSSNDNFAIAILTNGKSLTRELVDMYGYIQITAPETVSTTSTPKYQIYIGDNQLIDTTAFSSLQAVETDLRAATKQVDFAAIPMYSPVTCSVADDVLLTTKTPSAMLTFSDAEVNGKKYLNVYGVLIRYDE